MSSSEMAQMGQDLMAILPLLVVLVTAVVALCFEMVHKAVGSLWSLIIGMAAATVIGILWLDRDTTAFSHTFRVDSLFHWAVIILCPTAILVALLARAEIKGEPREGTLYSLIGFSTVGSIILAGAGDLMFIVLGVLMNGLSGFALAAHPKDDPSSEGAMKYFIYGSVTGAVMVFGLGYWVGMTGSTYLSDLAMADLPLVPYALGFVALLAGTGYAASLFPFHFWTPDTFQGAPVSVAAFLSVTPKAGVIFALAQVMKDLPVDELAAPWLLAVVAAFSMTFGNVLALLQNNLVRLLAYSTVAQAGYWLIGAIAIDRADLAVPSLVVFGVAYAAMNIGAFAIVLGHGREIKDLNSVGRQRPWVGAAMTVFLFSLVGIPPLAGFAGKFLLFGAAISSDFAWLAVVAILNSAISLGVYLRIIYPLYFAPAADEEAPREPVLVRTTWAVCLLVTVAIGIGVQWVVNAVAA